MSQDRVFSFNLLCSMILQDSVGSYSCGFVLHPTGVYGEAQVGRSFVRATSVLNSLQLNLGLHPRCPSLYFFLAGSEFVLHVLPSLHSGNSSISVL